MPQKKEEAIQDILADYEKLANLVLNQLDVVEKLIAAGQTQLEEEKFDALMKEEEHINKLEVKLSDKVINAIALYQPVASQIRQLMSCYRITISLERIGDLAVSIVKLMSRIENKDVYLSLSEFIARMMNLSVDMSRRSMLSFINNDMELAKWTIRSETVVDEFNRKMLRKVAERTDLLVEDKNVLLSFINVKEIAAAIERISDHAANIAEASYYSFEGRDIRHKRN
ncbi:MAG TPA: PhoU domain-containing protein [Prolixibacteraceae bacterium]|jgi:phosphate transport system protein|nr:PhoU domain-containing protein [Prolixibacteraceae bacterium]